MSVVAARVVIAFGAHVALLTAAVLAGVVAPLPAMRLFRPIRILRAFRRRRRRDEAVRQRRYRDALARQPFDIAKVTALVFADKGNGDAGGAGAGVLNIGGLGKFGGGCGGGGGKAGGD